MNKKLKMISYIQFNFFETGKSLVDCAETDLEEADINVSMRLLYRVLVMKIWRQRTIEKDGDGGGDIVK